MPAPARTDAGTASQLIRSVRRLIEEREGLVLRAESPYGARQGSEE